MHSIVRFELHADGAGTKLVFDQDGFPEDQREMVDQMLENNVVLRYQNNDPWCDIHPAVQRISRIAEEADRLRGERAAGKSGGGVG